MTDGTVRRRSCRPPQVVRYDGDDPYLVVAADKGTARVLRRRQRDRAARAASGSATRSRRAARPATTTRRWASPPAARGSRCAGTSATSAIDPDRDDFTVVGIGDMSGDVFGNGMLLSHHIQLVAAFDHRHVFLDPDPDPEASWQERKRLFELPRSSWADYDAALISPGGGVYPRTAKSVPITDEVRAAARHRPARRRVHARRADPRASCARRSTCSTTAASAPT